MLVGYVGTNFFKRCATGQMPWQMSKLILVCGSDFRLYDGFDLKNYLLMRW